MGHSARDDEGSREDVVKRAKDAQCSFEQMSRAAIGTFSWRSVSDSEGMAAFGMLGLQQGDGGSRSTSGEIPNSGYPRIDSASWTHLLASGGENVQGTNIGGRVASPVASGETDARTRSSPFASGNGDDPLANDPGPMPALPPFGGCGSHGESSRSGSRSAGGSHDSRSGPLRISRNPLEDAFSSFSFENYPSSTSYPPPPWTRFEHSRSVSSATGSIAEVDGGDGANSFYDPDRWVDRQFSFDPLRPIRGMVYPMPRFASDERPDPAHGAWPYYPVPASEPGPEDVQHSVGDKYQDCSDRNRPFHPRDAGALGRGFDEPHSRPYPSPDRSPPQLDGGEKTPEPSCSPQVDVPVTDYSRVTPAGHQRSDSSEERTMIPSKPKPPATTNGQTAKPSGFDLLASMIPDLSKMNRSKARPINSSTGGSNLQVSAHSSSAAVGKNAAESEHARGVSGLTKAEVLSTVSRSPSPPLAPSPVSDGLETEIREYHEFLHGRPVLLTGRRAAISRYLYKKRRRPFVQQERDNDPERELQKKSRQRPRLRGKFRKTGQDFVSITKVQTAGEVRSFSGEVPASEVEAKKKKENGTLLRSSFAVSTASRR